MKALIKKYNFVPSMVFFGIFFVVGVDVGTNTVACMAYLLFLALASSRQPAAQKS